MTTEKKLQQFSWNNSPLKTANLSWILQPKVVFSLLIILGIFAYWMASKPLKSWVFTSFLVDYDSLGFVKRGLFGTLIPDSWHSIELLTLISRGMDALLIVMLVGLLITFLQQSYITQSNTLDSKSQCLSREAAIWGILTVVAPFFIVQISFDSGRYDHLLLIIAMLGMFFVTKSTRYQWAIIPAYALLPLIHEAAVLLVLPPFLMTWTLLNAHNKRSLFPIIVCGLLISTVFIFVIVFGKFPNDWQLVSKTLQDSASGFTVNDGISMILTRSLADNIEMTLSAYPKRSVQLVLTLVFMLPFWVLLRQMHLVVAKRLSGAYWIPLASLSVMPLFILGYDFFRWIAQALLNLWVIYSFLMIYFRSVPVFFEQLNLYRKWLFGCLLAFIWMGPLGVMSYFPDPWVIFVGN